MAEITLKEVFERIIVLETKFDAADNRNVGVRKLFRRYVFLLIILLILDILVSSL